jgi:hypothetical protein
LSIDEWAELLTWSAELSGQDKGIEDVIKSMPRGVHRILVHEPFQILPVLTNLCQGYLVACAESELRGKYLDDIKPALEEIGWVGETRNRVIAKGNSLFKDDFKGEWEKVQMSNWWYEDIFAEDNNYLSIKQDELKNNIAVECGEKDYCDVHDDIQELFNNIATEDKNIDPPTVAKAYIAIAKVLVVSI